MDTNTTGIRCPSCTARMRVPDATIGRKVACPKCDAVFIASPETPTRPAHPARSAAEPSIVAATQIVLRCSSCAAKVKIPSAATPKKYLCPKCRHPLNAPGSRDPDDDILKLAPTEGEPVQDLPPSTLIKPVPLAPDRTCPSCKKTYPGDAKVCTACGIYLKTGRSILTTQDENLDQIYVFTENLLRWLSFLIFFGFYPVASEAFGLRKPWVVRGIALLTVLVGGFQLYCFLTDAPAQETIDRMMLWGGDPARVDDLRAKFAQALEDEGTASQEDKNEALALADSMLGDIRDSAQPFQAHQLLTHAFLHADVLHLAGNMLFLMVLGAYVNALIGNVWTLILYPLLAIVAGFAQLLSVANGPPSAMLGASGAVMGLAGMYLVLFPVHQVHMAIWLRWGIFLPLRFSFTIFAVRGFWVVLFYIAFDVVFTVFRIEDDTAHWAHLGGFIAGATIAALLLVTRRVDARGGDLFSAVLGRHAWKLIGRPRGAAEAV